MQLYTINATNNNRRDSLIERFESFVWTERYSAYGDFNLVVEPSSVMQSSLVSGVLVGFDESDRLMRIESVLRTKDDEGKKTLTIKGKSLETIFEDRAAKKTLSASTWDLVETVGGCIAYMVNTVCVIGTGISSTDVIPSMTISNLSGTSAVVSMSIKAGNLYERVKEVCDAYDLGFRITYVPNSPTLAFAVYKGNDRTGLGEVAFSENLENLSDTSYFVSKEGYKNVAYVFSNLTSRIVTITGTPTFISGLNRRVLLVDATDIDLPLGAALNAALDQRGRDALSEHQEIILFDGTVNPNGLYKYNRDYFLGDLVTLRGDNKERQSMRVTEHIWSCDNDSFKSYPTLSIIGGV